MLTAAVTEINKLLLFIIILIFLTGCGPQRTVYYGDIISHNNNKFIEVSLESNNHFVVRALYKYRGIEFVVDYSLNEKKKKNGKYYFLTLYYGLPSLSKEPPNLFFTKWGGAKLIIPRPTSFNPDKDIWFYCDNTSTNRIRMGNIESWNAIMDERRKSIKQKASKERRYF